MTSFVLRTPDGADVGILGFANHEGEWPPAGPNPCVLMPFAHDAVARDDPRAALVRDHAGREFTTVVAYADDTMTVRLALDTGWRFELRSGASGTTWAALRDGVTLEGTGTFL